MTTIAGPSALDLDLLAPDGITLEEHRRPLRLAPPPSADPHAYVDGAPVAAHAVALRHAGMTIVALAAAAGVSESTVRTLTDSKGDRAWDRVLWAAWAHGPDHHTVAAHRRRQAAIARSTRR